MKQMILIHSVTHNPGKVLDFGVIETKQISETFEKVACLKEKLLKLCQVHSPSHGEYALERTCAAERSLALTFWKPLSPSLLHFVSQNDYLLGAGWVVGVENFLKGFNGMKWRTNDIINLACLNSLITYECFHIFNQLGHTERYARQQQAPVC